ncbi:hypothetical protein HPB48_014870 [Haemaphysalis longicornis]|uniref:Transposable element P transposase-like RNase H domain-containing protein n=1 Tax=Haemaphysalis longicornis TaxID=44386 RepID=A0A9J6FR49_HAELO|nr:hypothetical protein HPB48_014870 [Haemaphysalis longicornis]
MRIKSPKLYEHVRRHEILALPSKSCLYRHMAGFRSSFGYNASIFVALKKKTEGMGAHSCHGGIVFDEIKLSENISVKTSGELSGFVDLGSFTESNETKVSDHGLAIMFQPFQGDFSVEYVMIV